MILDRMPSYGGAAGAVGIDAGAAKRAQHPVLQGAAGDALTVGALTNSSADVGQAVSPTAGEERRLAVAGNRVARLSR
jgi:hypothetical protein